MILKAVELFGFKSFGEKTRIEFREGVTAIVGPNGCGKSNIVDAIKWVLGEQSTKTLRTSSMEEVIFNGTEDRKPLNVAEVTLILSNNEGHLPLDFDEIAIRRRVYRSGESEYAINNAPVRLRDVKELFFDTGIGKSAYSIMEQGKIDQILSSRPEDRRQIFEEAAGITRYRQREVEANQKLLRTEENMVHVESVLREVEKRYHALKAQAEKVERYRALSEEIFQIEIKQSLLKYRRIEKALVRHRERLRERQEERSRLKEQIHRLNDSVEDSLDTMGSLEHDLARYQRELYGLEVKRHSLSSQMTLLSEQISEIEGKISTDRVREQHLRDRLLRIESSIVEKEKEYERILEERRHIQSQIQEWEESIAVSERQIIAFEQEIADSEGMIAELEREREHLHGELANLTEEIVKELDEGLKRSNFSAKERVTLSHALRESLDHLLARIRHRREILQDFKRLGNPDPPFEEWLEEMARTVEQARDLYAAYLATEPSFLEAFTAPEGIITKKRAIDNLLEDVTKKIQSSRERIAELQTRIREVRTRNEQRRKSLEDLRLTSTRIATQAEALRETVNALLRDKEETLSLINQIQKEVDLSNRRLDTVKASLHALEREQKALLQEEASCREKIVEIERNIKEKNFAISSHENEIKQKMGELSRLQEDVERLQVEVARYEEEIKALETYFKDQHGRTLREFLQMEVQENPGDLARVLAEKREERRRLGNVNFMAAEEFKDVKDRYEFLVSQLSDLNKAKENLTTVLQEIRRESRELFLATYEKIKVNFHQVFRRLFGGGRAELKLLDPSDPLESGIEIFAQPPGKKLEHIGLLSGGERSLTAVALLFAIYMVKPSPFCILDEIDAPLDENNIGRFVELLREFSERSQFIVITHNKKTITGADNLLGVTMEESGISKIVTIRLLGKEEPSYAEDIV
ncbi:chromosome segregation SMC family protein [Spirochaeta thermophila]|uniref:Chromosome partition protein Smc n=1 Tax=Winmispira thermophila (strain ATCC 49972 / DSM 6192 / RI 19.B1) TaxID=665571 RepID=E0RSK7_WINT6|nr:AAA family ATPase [Spirochaeta thermophila]ADN01994.1 putative chromosome partition protein SmC [Spirochaeta thermophila DSM 6192]